jgi:hypothetical protein
MSSLASLRDQAANDEPQAPSTETRALAPGSDPTPNHYCLNAGHSANLLTEDRLFYYEGDGCPVCPVCQRQVVAQVPSYTAKGQPQIPHGLLGLAGRIGESVPY